MDNPTQSGFLLFYSNDNSIYFSGYVKITEVSHVDKNIHAIANISNIKLDMIKVEGEELKNLIRNIQDKLTNNFDINQLYGKQFKILARCVWLNRVYI
jgi:hypothetical protein